MANDIDLISKYVPMLDEIYEREAKTAILGNDAVQFVGANAVKVFKMTIDGLGDYSRNAGYVSGDVDGHWETLTLAIDRARTFSVDAMDNEETANLAFGRLAGEFERTKTIPEVDAYRFAKLAGTSNISAGTPADIVIGTTDVPALINEAERQLNEDGVPYEGRILFISESAYAGLQAKITRTIENGENGINRAVEYYDGMRVVRVPQSRFYTKISLLDGSTEGEEAGGYVGTTTTGYKINFMIVHPSAVVPVIKHVAPKIFTPAQNQSADAWKYCYRVYHDIFVLDNKVAGIYLHRGSTALS